MQQSHAAGPSPIHTFSAATHLHGRCSCPSRHAHRHDPPPCGGGRVRGCCCGGSPPGSLWGCALSLMAATGEYGWQGTHMGERGAVCGVCANSSACGEVVEWCVHVYMRVCVWWRWGEWESPACMCPRLMCPALDNAQHIVMYQEVPLPGLIHAGCGVHACTCIHHTHAQSHKTHT